MLQAHDLECQRGDRRLFSALAFELRPGQLLRVAGANGSGKTSLLRLLAGLALTAAALWILDEPLNALDAGAIGVLTALMVLPLNAPILIFGAGAVTQQMAGLDVGALLSLLGALLALALAPWALAHGLRVACEWEPGTAFATVTSMSHAIHRTAFAERLPRSRWFRFAAPSNFYELAGRLLPWFWGAALLFGVAGLIVGLVIAPTDFQQGDAYRIIFIHVPAAWMSMLIYLAMAFWAGLGLVLNTRLSSMMATALAPTGALMTFIALWTGALWGKPTWGAWWVWDARLTSELLLLFLYIGFMALQAASDDPRRGDRAGAILALVGVVNVPIIYFSVTWWNTLHQGSSISLTRAPSMANTMLAGLLLMVAAFWAWSIAVALYRVRSIILEREHGNDWVTELEEAR